MQKNHRMTLSIIALNYCLFGFDPFYWNCFNVIFCTVVLHMVSFLKICKIYSFVVARLAFSSMQSFMRIWRDSRLNKQP